MSRQTPGRRAALALAAALASAMTMGLSSAPAGPAPPSAADDMVLGRAAAPVTVIEYASVGCPHCGVWAREVFPAFKAKYVDTGKVRFVFREMLYGDASVAAAGFLTARCAGRPRYFQVVDAFFAAQPQMARDGDIMPSLRKIAADAGLNSARFAACLGDHAALAALQARSHGYGARDKITGTPTFVVGARKLDGEQSLAELDAAIAAARHRPGRP